MVKRGLWRWGLAAVAALTASGALAQRSLTIGLGYVPNVQFTPFYVADKLGYYKAEGLNVKFQHGYVSELLPLLLQGKLDFVVGDAEDAIFARAQGAPVRYVMALYQRVPVTVFSLPGKGIKTPAQLKGKTVGIAGPFGSSYFAFQALLAKAGLREGDVKLATIGFTQLDAVRRGSVDAAVGFVNNEVVQFKAAGITPNTLDTSAAYPMVGAGLMTTEATLKTDLAARVVRASQRGLALTLADPARAYTIGKAVFGSGGGSLAVLKASLPLIRSAYTARFGLGASDPQHWTTALAFLKGSGKLPAGAQASDFFSNAYVSKSLH